MLDKQMTQLCYADVYPEGMVPLTYCTACDFRSILSHVAWSSLECISTTLTTPPQGILPRGNEQFNHVGDTRRSLRFSHTLRARDIKGPKTYKLTIWIN